MTTRTEEAKSTIQTRAAFRAVFNTHNSPKQRRLGNTRFKDENCPSKNPKPRRTFQNSQSRRRSYPEKNQEKNEQHFVLSSTHIESQNEPLRGQTVYKTKTLPTKTPKPRGTLPKTANQEEKTNPKNKKKNGQHFVLFEPDKNPETHSRNKTQQILPHPI